MEMPRIYCDECDDSINCSQTLERCTKQDLVDAVNESAYEREHDL